MTIAVAEAADARSLAEMHSIEIATGFLRQLGLPFLEHLYAELIDSEICICLVAKDAHETTGFVCGSLDTPLFFRRFKRRRPWKIVWALRPLLFRPRLLKGALETAAYDREFDHGTSGLPAAELLTLAVQSGRRRTGVGGALVGELARRMDAADAKEFKVVVGAKLTGANALYQKMGFTEVGHNSVHADRPSAVLVASSARTARGADKTGGAGV